MNVPKWKLNNIFFKCPIAGAAVACGKVMWDMGSRNTVHVLRGGYEDFSALYPFLRTQKIIFMPRVGSPDLFSWLFSYPQFYIFNYQTW